MELESILKTVKLNGKADEVIWKPGNASFTTKLGVEWLESESHQDIVTWNFLWKIKVPPKVLISIWIIQRAIVRTRAFLFKRLGQGIASTICPYC